MKVSFCTIVKNEERCIARCIRSLYGIADELIVVDTGSTDRTVEIAQSLGAEIYHFEWIGDFSAAKNFALSKATGDWIVFLDADEYFPSKDMAQSALAKMKHYDSINEVDGLSHIIRNFNSDPEKGDLSRYVDAPNCRVFKNRPHIRFICPIHERISNIVIKDDFRAIKTPPDVFLVYHDGYKDSIIEDKDRRNLEIEFRELDSGNPDPLLLFYIGRDYYHLGEYENALPYLQRYFDTGNKEDYFSVSHFILHVNALVRLRKEGFHAECLKVLRKGLKDFPNHPGLHLMNGFVSCGAQKLPQSIEGFENGFAALKTFDNPNEMTSNLLAPSHARFYCLLADNYFLKGDEERGIQALKESLKVDRHYAPSLSSLAYYAETRKDEILAFLNENYTLYDPADLNTLLAPFSSARPGVVFLSIFEKYFALTNAKDINLFTMMAVVGEFASAVTSFLSRYELTQFEPYLSKALAFAVISGQPKPLEAVAACPSEPYKRLAQIALGNETKIEQADLRPFAVTLHLALAFSGATQPVKRFAERSAACFDKDGLLQCVLLYRKHNCFEEVLEICEAAAAAANDIPVKAAVAVAAMECAYNLENYDLALRYIEQAREWAAHPYLLASYARFMADKLNKGPMRNKLNKLSQDLFAQDLLEANKRRERLLLIDEERDDAESPIEIESH